MDTGFFGTKYFAISAAVAVAILAGGASAYWLSGVQGAGWSATRECDAPALAGNAIPATPSTTIEEDGRRRSETYTIDASAFQGGALDLCLSVGEILVSPATGSTLELEILTTGDEADAVEATETYAQLRADGTRLMLGVWESQRGESGAFFGTDSAEVRVILRVPATGAYDVLAVNDVGDVRVSDLLVHALDLRVDVGSVIALGIDLEGDASLETDVGDAILNATSVQSGEIVLAADVGNVEAELPQRADVGYDAHAETDVGVALVRIGPTESNESEANGAGETETARSAGFDGKPTKVVVRSTTNVGDARINAD